MNIKSDFEGKYLVVDMGENPSIVEHQLGMILNNKIKYFLETKQQIKNNRLYFFYDTKNKTNLNEILKNKISFNTFLNLSISLTKAMEEALDYQLSTEGIILDRKYIFINDDGSEPEFIYIPFSSNNIKIDDIRKFLKGIIMDNCVNIGNENFGEIISILNGDEKTSYEIRKKLEKFTKKPVNRNIQYNNSNFNINNSVQKNNQVNLENNIQKIDTEKVKLQKEKQEYKNTDTKSQIFKKSMDIPGIKEKNNNINTSNNNINKEKTDKKNNDNNKVSKIRLTIITVTGILLVLCAFMANNGFFNDSNGNFDISMPVMFLVVIFGLDFLIYRRMSKGVEKKDTAPKKEKIKNNKKQNKNITSKNKKDKKIVKKNENSFIDNNESLEETDIFIDDFSDSTELMEDYNCIYPYFENIIGEKIYIRGKLRFGKTPGAYGYSINNNKVSRIHADVFIENNNLYIIDLQSKNGTYINDNLERIPSNQSIELFDGYKVRMANEEFIVHI